MAIKLILSHRRILRGSFLATTFLHPSLASAFAPSAVFPHSFSPICQPTLPVVRHQQIHCKYSTTKTFRRMASSYTGSDNGTDAMREEGKTYIDKLALIAINSDNQQLVARSRGKSVFFTPGGKREPNETDEEALIRECMEELSVSLTTFSTTPTQIEPYGTFEAQAFGKAPGTMVRMTCFRVCPREAEIELEKLVKASDEVDELKWVDSTFDREKLTVTGIMIIEDLKMKGLID